MGSKVLVDNMIVACTEAYRDELLAGALKLGHVLTLVLYQRFEVRERDLTVSRHETCGVWCLVFGVWCLVFGVWCLVFGVWCLVFGVWCLVFGV